MDKIDMSGVILQSVVTHHVGNKQREEELILSDFQTNIKDVDTEEYLIEYYLSPFKQIDYQVFSHSVELEMNEIYTLVKRLFADKNNLVSISQSIATLLFNNSNHPKIKEGELSIVYFKEIYHEGEKVDAIGIMKSENTVPFIKIKEDRNSYAIEHDFGFELKGIDKGCLIFNSNQEQGYDVLIVNNRAEESLFWTENFLNVTPRADAFHKTKNVLELAKEFITKKLPEQFEVERADSIDMLNRTMNYFKKNESYNKDEFESAVFYDENVKESFNQFEKSVSEERDLDINEAFDISIPAVKKQSRTYKSVLKLDKNFHVYIHGNKDLIEKGIDEEGRKYYKIYYINEA
jgi:hypothetical protein